MYQISNRQYSEVMEMLQAYVLTECHGEPLFIQNRYRRARLLIRALAKRKPIDREY